MGGAGSMRHRALLAVIGGALCAAFWVSPAYGHNSLTGSDPKNGARLAEAPQTVILTFLAKVDPSATVTITGPDGRRADTDPPGIKGNKVTLQLGPVPAGTYTVSYRVPSGDGHPVTGQIRFTVLTGATVGATPGPASVGASSSPSARPHDDATPGPARVVTGRQVAEQGPASAWWAWALAGAVVLLAVLLVVRGLARRRGRS